MNGNHKESDEEVEEMLRTWDVVKCKVCGKKISMLDAKIETNENGYEYFACKEH